MREFEGIPIKRNLINNVRWLKNCISSFVLALSIVSSPNPGWAGTSDPSGVSDLILPAAIILAPILLPYDLFFGDATPRHIKSAQKKASAILANQRTPILFDGLYVRGIDLGRALQGMLVDSAVPLIEIDSVGSKWLIEQSKTPTDMIAKALEHPFIRIQLAPAGDPACFSWKGEDWVNKIPIRPGTCMKISFEKILLSDVQLSVNTSSAANAELQWEYLDRATNKVLLSVPFWQYQQKNMPLKIWPYYDPASSGNGQRDDASFVAGLDKLTQRLPHVGSDGRPYMLKWQYTSLTSRSFIFIETEAAPTKVVTPLKVMDKLWPYEKSRESWESAYKKAYETGRPTLAWGQFLIFPKDNYVGSIRVDDFGFAAVRDNLLFNVSRPANSISAYIKGSLLNGQGVWSLDIQPDGMPDELLGASGCKFWQHNIELTLYHLILQGNINCSVGKAVGVEWSIPRSLLPVIPLTDSF